MYELVTSSLNETSQVHLPSMRKVDDGEKKKKEKEKKRITFLVVTTSLPAVYRPNDDRWNAARSCQFRNIDHMREVSKGSLRKMLKS